MIPVSIETKNTGIIRVFLSSGSNGIFYDNVNYSVHDGYVHDDYIRAGYTRADYIHVDYIRVGYNHDDYIRVDYNRDYHKPRQLHYV